jgi:lipid-binding SYLF domain-containing protein
MKKFLPCVLGLSLIGVTALFTPTTAKSADDKDKWNDRVENAGTVMKEILNVPDDIPQDLIDKSECVIVFPSVLKAAFGVGASYGRGVMTCRSGANFKGKWGAPSMMALEGASIGFQIGGQATDFVLLVMNDRGASSILSSKVKLGADASVAAGPKGRDTEADTDVSMRAEVLTYSRARGVFAGVSLEGSTVRPDNDGNEAVYGQKMAAKDIVLKGAVPPPASAASLLGTLDKASPHNVSDHK